MSLRKGMEVWKYGLLTSLVAILYKALGIGTTTILALSGVYGTIAFSSNLITTLTLTDQWGRRK